MSKGRGAGPGWRWVKGRRWGTSAIVPTIQNFFKNYPLISQKLLLPVQERTGKRGIFYVLSD